LQFATPEVAGYASGKGDMRRKKFSGSSALGIAAVVVGPLLLGIGVASAQAPEAATTSEERAVRLQPAQQVAEAKNYVRKMETIRATIQRDLEGARGQNDVVKTLCLDDKLNQIDVAITKSSDRARSLNQAAERSDGDLANHEFTILSVLHDRAIQLDAEAQQCIGKEAGFVGESSSSMTLEGYIAPEEADFPLFPVLFEPPNCASCIQ